MTLLYIYLGTTIVSYAVVSIFSLACKAKIERDGYKFVRVEKSFMEKLALSMSNIFKASIPVYNIANTITILCVGEKMYDQIENELLKEGKIYKPVNEIKLSNDSKPILSSENIEKDKSENCAVKYEDMSIAEKKNYLKKQRDISLEYLEMGKSMNNDTNQQGPVLGIYKRK